MKLLYTNSSKSKNLNLDLSKYDKLKDLFLLTFKSDIYPSITFNGSNIAGLNNENDTSQIVVGWQGPNISFAYQGTISSSGIVGDYPYNSGNFYPYKLYVLKGGLNV